MKKIVSLVLSAALLVAALSALAGCSKDDGGVEKTGEVLYVYNWGEYISNGDVRAMRKCTPRSRAAA